MCSCKPNSLIKSFAPGKIMLAGEWAVLEPGNPCIALAIGEGVTAEFSSISSISGIDCKNKVCISLEKINSEICAEIKESKIIFEEKLSDEICKYLSFVKKALEVSFLYLCEQGVKVPSFRLKLRSSIKKSGFGSSSATVVSVISGLLKFCDFSFSQKDIFKLGSIAHFLVQGKVGSCFDVAVAAYNCNIFYKRFDPEWLKQKLITEKLSDIISQPWPFLKIKEIFIPEDIKISVKHVGSKASTTDMISKVHAGKKEVIDEYKKICEEIGSVVKDFVKEIESVDCFDKKKIISLIKLNRRLLLRLSKITGVVLETPEIKRFCDEVESRGGAAKLSGAGGGDIVIKFEF